MPLHDDLTPFSVAWPDAGDAIRRAVEVPESRLYSKFESFFVFTDLPHGKFRNDKIRRVLGWNPRYQLEARWNKPVAGGLKGRRPLGSDPALEWAPVSSGVTME